ncbi:DUF2993 family protein [Cellulomonas sp. PhB143]|nr:DUF2993 family protein [Cellulomonas sp. PhB143]
MGWLVGVVVVLALLVAVDRAAAWVVAGRVADGLEDDGATDVGVHVGGFPFLTQLARGELEDVTGTAGTAAVAATGDAPAPVTLDDLRFAAQDLGTRDPWRAGHVTASAVLPASSLTTLVSDATGADLQVATADGALEVTTSTFGLDVVVSVAPRVDDGHLAVGVSSVRVGPLEVSPDQLPDALAGLVTDRLDGLRVPLDLPDGVRLERVAVRDDGVRVVLSGEDVALGELAAS